MHQYRYTFTQLGQKSEISAYGACHLPRSITACVRGLPSTPVHHSMHMLPPVRIMLQYCAFNGTMHWEWADNRF